MIHFDHSFLVETSSEIWSSSKYDFTYDEKVEATVELRDLEIENVLSKFDLEGVSKDQLENISRILTFRMNSFLKIGYGIAINQLKVPMDGGREWSSTYPKNIEHVDYSYIESFFDRFKLQNLWFGIGRVCESIEDYHALLEFHNSDERVYKIEKGGFNHPVNRNLYEAEDRIKKLKEKIQSRTAVLDDQINGIKREIIEYIETSTLKLSYYERFKDQLKEEVSTTEAI